MSSSALNQIANALQNGIGIDLNLTGYTWESPPVIGSSTSNSAFFTSISTINVATSSFTASAGINDTAIGALTSNVGYFTLLTASSITGQIGQTTSNLGNFTALQTSSITGRANTLFVSSITGNAIDGPVIGQNTSNSAFFTQLQASSITGRANTLFVSSITGNAIDGPVIGQNTSNSAFFTTVRAASTITNAANVSTLIVSSINAFNSFTINTSTLGVSGYFSNTGVTAVQEIIETLNLKSTTSGVVTHDWTEGAIWYHSSMTANFSCSLINLPLIPNRSLVATLILNQSNTPFYASTLLLNGTRTNIKWASGTTPTPTANRTEIESFTLFYIGTTWTALGQYTSFG